MAEPIESMGKEYIPTCTMKINGKNVGKYANRPMDASWVLEFKKTLLRWTPCLLPGTSRMDPWSTIGLNRLVAWLMTGQPTTPSETNGLMRPYFFGGTLRWEGRLTSHDWCLNQTYQKTILNDGRHDSFWSDVYFGECPNWA